MNYCKRKDEPTDTVHCLNCEHCLPPGERTGGRMCRDEMTDLEVIDIIKGLDDDAKTLLDFQMQCLDADLHDDPHRFDGIARLLHVDFGNTKDARGQDALSGISNTVFVGIKEQLEKNGQKGLYCIELTDEDKAEMGKRKGYQLTMKMDFTKQQPRKAMEILEKMTWRDNMSKHEMVRCKIYQTIYKLMEESEGPNLAIDYATGEPFWKYWDMMAEQMPEINEYK